MSSTRTACDSQCPHCCEWGPCESWRNEVRDSSKSTQGREAFNIPEALAHMHRRPPKAHGQSPDATSQHRTELSASHLGTGLALPPAWKVRAEQWPSGWTLPLPTRPSTSSPSAGHREKRTQSVDKIGQLCRKNRSQVQFLCSVESLVKCWLHRKKRKSITPHPTPPHPTGGRDGKNTPALTWHFTPQLRQFLWDPAQEAAVTLPITVVGDQVVSVVPELKSA